MEYSVTYAVSGYTTIRVEADDVETAIKLANEKLTEVNCGELDSVDGIAIDINAD